MKRPRPPALLQQFLTAAMSYLCRTHNIAPAIVGTSDDVGRLASYWMDPKTTAESMGDQDDPLTLLVGWRGELVGKPLYDIYLGKKAMRVQDPTDEMPLMLCDVDH
jgi:ribonuclease D